MPFGKKETHESYALIGITNTTGGSRPLFGSSIKHDRTIRLRIKKASIERSLHREWYYGYEDIIEVELSSDQFAQFITTPNVSDGVPCTINRLGGKYIETPPYKGQNDIFNKELEEDFKKAMDDARDLIKDSSEMLSSKGPLKVQDKKELLGKITKLVQHIESNMPFLHKQFTGSMNKTVTAAKAEIESFYTQTIMKMGQKALEELNKPAVPQIED
jgi:ElaB/YqjD/DUF883 family membrane-anchored ribosome-binding protein